MDADEADSYVAFGLCGSAPARAGRGSCLCPIATPHSRSPRAGALVASQDPRRTNQAYDHAAMALEPATLREIGGPFLEALQLSPEARGPVDYQLNQLAELLPRPDAWATLGQGDVATLVLLTGDVLLTISREPATEEERSLVVTAYRLGITEVSYRRKRQRTVWDFQFRDRHPLRVEGWVDDPGAPGAAGTFDQAEALGRALARSIGWPILERPSVRDEEPRDDQPTNASSSKGKGPSRQQVTDLWGNPISKPRSRNR